MSEKDTDAFEGIELSDEELKEVAGGRIDWRAAGKLGDYIKRCKLKGYTLDDAITEINFSYKGDRNAKYRAEFSDYVSQHW